ncbi:WD40-repeat-containing domain [Phytophthora cactorum]|nr:WD40-repeat-containing domain [Phytophthora cactorum]
MFGALSKPIIREDGLLIVGTEVTADLSTPTGEKNRIFVTNFLSSTGSQPPAHIMVEQEVRDIDWMGAQAAIVAIGNEIHLIQLGDLSIGGPCRLQDPINPVHSDTIRELAVSPTTNSHVLSGGFDQTVVLTDLRNQGDPKTAAVIGKFDAKDVVSSVRWSPTDSHVSWTTDGGDFQVADTRVRSPQLQAPLSNYLNVGTLGGLFAHEYLSSFNVALGFERGHVAFVDLRMPRQTSCTSLIESNLTGVGEIRRSKSNKFALFGRGGFSMASLNGAASSLEQITLHRRQPQVLFKTSGDFSYERGVYLAVSDKYMAMRCRV